MQTILKRAQTATLDIAYEETGPADGRPVFLMHGFPDDVRAWDGVVAPLAANGHRVLAPYLRGYGPTRFLRAATPRSGQQAALGDDLRALMDALQIERAALAGYDWGWPGLLHCRGIMATAGHGAGDDRWLQHSEYRHRHPTRRAGS